MSMMHGWNPFMTFGSVWGVLWMLVLVALTVWAAVALTRALLPRSERGDRAGHDDALDVLRARYARGEIDEDEYRTRRETLTTTSGGR
jgi:putative membrane protein